jgi:hypothetical protein
MIDASEVIEIPEVDEAEDVIEQVEAPEGESDVGEGAPEDAGLVVEIGGGDDEDASAPEWVRNVRRENRELKKRLKALETTGGTVDVPALPEKPTLEACDYDTPVFEAKLEAWYEAKREHDAREAEAKTLQEKAEQRWQAKLSTYDAGKEKLGAPDFDDAEATVSEIFAKPFPGIRADDVRMGIIKQGVKDPTTLVYALGRNPEKAKALAEIDDPVEFAVALGRMEATMKVVRAGAKPAPERRIGGVAPGVAGAVDNTLERLREEAAKTGDFSKVAAYKRQMK